MSDLDLLIPEASGETTTAVLFADVVTGADGPTVWIDGEEEAQSVAPTSLVALVVGQRVSLILHGRTLIVVGVLDGTDTHDAASITSGTLSVDRLPAATDAASGIAQRATPAEATAGTETTHFITPALLASVVAAAAPTHGTGTNGQWTKFPDGTLICSQKFTITPSASNWTQVTWTYPVAFTATPHVTVSNGNIAGTVTLWGSRSETATSAAIGMIRSNNTASDLTATAYGFWK